MRRNGLGAAGPLRWALAAALIMTLLLYVPTPYLVFLPGLAEPAAPLVKAGALDPQGQGEFLFTTVYMSGRSNYLDVLRAALGPDRELLKKQEVLRGGTIEEYGFRSVVMMEDSQSDAIEAAYRAAKVPYTAAPKSVFVSAGGTDPNGLHAGDRIEDVGGVAVTSLAQLQRLLSGLSGAEAAINVLRGRERRTVRIQPVARGGLALDEELPRALGVRELTEIRAILPDDPSRSVTIEAKGVGGPSAGLIFALQAYDRLTAGDLTRGYRIAGTGTIDPSGRTGPVGGTGLKVVTAARAGVDLFLVPPGNYKEAVRKAGALGTTMKVMQAATLKDAIEALEALNPKDRKPKA